MAGDRDALWQGVREGRSYTVKFVANGGTYEPEAQIISYNGKAERPDDSVMKKPGNLFKGWFKEASCINEWDFNTNAVTKDTTLHAKWEEVSGYMITFIINSAKAPVYGQDVLEGERIIQPENPERMEGGFIFGVWYENNPTTPWNFNTPVTKDMELTGTWIALGTSPQEYAVRFVANGGSPVPADKALTMGAQVPEPTPGVMIKAGKTFGGWYSDAACTIPWLFNPAGTVAADTVAGETWIYAKWNDLNTYTVNYVTDGGAPIPDQEIKANNAYIIPMPADPAKTGYTFGGWYWNDPIEGYVPWAPSNQVRGNVILYAKWNPISYTVKFNANGGGGTLADQNFTYDIAQNLRNNTSTNIIRTGYTFTGWNTLANGTGTGYTNNQSVINLLTTPGDLTLYAQWSLNSYTITFDSGGGTPAPAPRQANHFTTLVAPTSPTKNFGASETPPRPGRQVFTGTVMCSLAGLTVTHSGYSAPAALR
jgi:uncharacterized repeat protein (TIGR02543 family)